MINITYPNTQLTFTTGITGSTGTTISSNSISTNTVNLNSLILSNGRGQTGNILSTNGTDLVWVTPSIGVTGITGITGITSNLNMQSNNITNANTINCTTLNSTNIIGPSTITNPVTFANPPISITSTNLSTLATKSYVDNVSLNNIYNLYLNKSSTILLSGTTYYALSNTPTTTISQILQTQTSTAGFPGASIGSFISEPIGITQLPTSLWCLNIWGTISSLTDATNYYAEFSLYNNDTTITITPIGTSTNSANHIALTSTNIPYKYTVNFTLSSSRTTNTTDRILIELFLYKSSVTTTQTVTTYFENPYYSYSQIQISNPISSLPSIWSGIVNSDLNMNNFNITSTGDMSISCPNKILSFDNLGTTGIFIGTNTSVPTVINLLSPGSTGSIIISKPILPSYTTTPTTGKIGEIIDVPLLTTPALPSTGEGVEVASYLLKPGVWIVSATSGFINTIINGTIRNITIYIKNGDTFICQHQTNAQSNSNVGPGTTHQLSCNGIIGITTESTIKLYQAIKISIANAYTVAPSSDTALMFKFQFVRIA